MKLTKRDILRFSGALFACDAAFPSQSWALKTSSLRELGQSSGIKYGLCESSSRYAGMRGYFERLASECSLFSPGNDFNWRTIERKPGLYSFGSLDIMANYCRDNHLGMIGHTLCWYHTVPQWAKSLSPDDFRRAFHGYLRAATERYTDLVVRFDVVNEPIDPRSSHQDGLRQSDFLMKLGAGYIQDTFDAVRSQAPKTKLCLNEFGIETTDTESVRKRELFLKLIETLHSRKTPIDVIGLQSHLDTSKRIDTEGLRHFLRRVKSLGYEISITELDVNDVALPADANERDAAVASYVDNYLGSIFSESRPNSIVNWGFSDKYTWLNNFYKRSDGLPLRPLAFDADLGRKPMWNIIRKYIEGVRL